MMPPGPERERECFAPLRHIKGLTNSIWVEPPKTNMMPPGPEPEGECFAPHLNIIFRKRNFRNFDPNCGVTIANHMVVVSAHSHLSSDGPGWILAMLKFHMVTGNCKSGFHSTLFWPHFQSRFCIWIAQSKGNAFIFQGKFRFKSQTVKNALLLEIYTLKFASSLRRIPRPRCVAA